MQQIKPKGSSLSVRAVLLDFDGTISTLRHGWEQVMEPMMIEYLGAGSQDEARRYIDESTGIQTIHQMKWLAEQVRSRGGQALDPWAYKAEYNRRLMLGVAQKRRDILAGSASPDGYLIQGAKAFLSALRGMGVALHIASGTDHPDVLREAELLGVAGLVDSIAGAPVGEESCSKEMVLRRLAQEKGLQGGEVCVIGDGKVEIALGVELGARTLGLATDEERGQDINPHKREKLIRAGAEAIAGDFADLNGLMDWMNLGGKTP
ncbi:MAG: HAD family hydrolase [Clostridiales bacterium]|nr:HAD family hydrolase [Clostridiales bacterium]